MMSKHEKKKGWHSQHMIPKNANRQNISGRTHVEKKK